MIELLIWPMAASLLGLGVFAMISPAQASRLYGIPESGAWVQIAGVRDVFLGLAFVLVYLHGSRQLVGELCLATLVVPIADAWLTRKAGALKPSLIHISGAFAVAGLGLAFLFTNW